MKRKKKIVLVLLAGIVIIQFIQPRHNKNEQILNTDVTKVYSVPGNVHSILKRSCYDCHSNNTNYPWYSRIQPLGWVLSRHIRKGKSNVNFSEFGSYTLRRQRSKLKAIENSIEERSMPLRSYAALHRRTRLGMNEREILIKWVNTVVDSIISK